MRIPTRRRALDTQPAQRMQMSLTILRMAQLHSYPSSPQKALTEGRRACYFKSNMGFDYYIELYILYH